MRQYAWMRPGVPIGSCVVGEGASTEWHLVINFAAIQEGKLGS